MGSMGGGGGGRQGPSMTMYQGTSTVAPPPEVAAKYRALWNRAEPIADIPWENYSNNPDDFVAGLNDWQLGGIGGLANNVYSAQPYVNTGMNTMQGALGAYNAASGMANTAGNTTIANNDIAAMSNPYYSQASQYTQNAATAPGGYEAANPYFGQANGNIARGAGATNRVGVDEIGQYLSPYQGQVINSTMNLLGQQNEQAMSGALGNVIRNGGFGGDRAGIMLANQNQQNTLANAKVLGDLNNMNYAQALNAAVGQRAQDQNDLARAVQAGQAQGQIGATAGQLRQADLGRQLQAGNQMANIGTARRGAYETQQQMAKADAERMLAAGQAMGQFGQGMGQIGNAQVQAGLGYNQSVQNGLESLIQGGTLAQQTEQARKDAMYNQWLQMKAYPFLTTQWLSDMYGGLGPLFGSTTNQSGTSFSIPLSDPRLKTGVGERRAFRDGGSADAPEVVGKTFDGQPIYRYSLMGGPAQLGMMADEVAQKSPESVFDLGGVLAMDYAGATDKAAEIGHERGENVRQEVGAREHAAGGGGIGAALQAQAAMLARKKEQSGPAGGGWVPKGGGKQGQQLSPHPINVPKAELTQPRPAPPPLNGMIENMKGLAGVGKDLKGLNLGGLGGLGGMFDTAAATAAAPAATQVADTGKTVADTAKHVITDVHDAGKNIASLADLDLLFARDGGRIGAAGGGMMPFADEQKGFIPVGGRGRNAIPFAGAGNGKSPFPTKTLDNSPPPQMMTSHPEDIAKQATGGDKGAGGEGGGGGGQGGQQMMKGAMDLLKQGQSFMGKAGSTAGQATGALGQGVSGAAQGAHGATQGIGGLAANLGNGAGGLASSAASGAHGLAGGAQGLASSASGLASGAQGLASAAAPAAQGAASALPAAASAAPAAASALPSAAAPAASMAAGAAGAAGAAAPAAAGAAAAGAALPAAAAPAAAMAAAAPAAAAAGAGAAAAGGAGLLGLLPLLFLSDPKLKTGVGRIGYATDGGVPPEEDSRLNTSAHDEAPPGTHYKQFGPNRILMDDKTGAAVHQLNKWENAAPQTQAINDILPENHPKAAHKEQGSSGAFLADRHRQKEGIGAVEHSPREVSPPIRVASTSGGNDADDGGLYSTSMNRYMRALQHGETGGRSDPYHTVGVADRHGDHPYGIYQIMGRNIAPWAKEAGYGPMSPQEFMDNAKAQEDIARHMFAKYIQQGGSPQVAAAMWLGGPGYAKHMGATDALGTDVAEYVARFNRALGNASGEGPDLSKMSPYQRSFVARSGGEDEGGLGALDFILPLAAAGMQYAANAPYYGSGYGLASAAAAGLGTLGGMNQTALQNKRLNQQLELERLRDDRAAEKQQHDIGVENERLGIQKGQFEIEQNRDAARRKALDEIGNPNGGAPAGGSGIAPIAKPTAPAPAPAPAPADTPPATGGGSGAPTAPMAPPPMKVTPGPDGPITPTMAQPPADQPKVQPATAVTAPPRAPAVNDAIEQANLPPPETASPKGDVQASPWPVVDPASGKRIDWDMVPADQRLPKMWNDLKEAERRYNVYTKYGQTPEAGASLQQANAIREQIKEVMDRGYVAYPNEQGYVRLPGKMETTVEQKSQESFTANQHARAAEEVKEQTAKAKAAKNVMLRLGMMRHEFSQLPNSGWTAPGAFADKRVDMLKSLNGVLSVAGLPTWDDKELASAESLAKDKFRLGTELARTLGAHEAGFIVTQAVAANPGMENTPKGFKRIVSSLEQMQQYEIDRAEFIDKYYSKNRTLEGADSAFERKYPREAYIDRAIAGAVHPSHMQQLLKAKGDEHRWAAELIDKEYGPGTARAIDAVYGGGK